MKSSFQLLSHRIIYSSFSFKNQGQLLPNFDSLMSQKKARIDIGINPQIIKDKDVYKKGQSPYVCRCGIKIIGEIKLNSEEFQNAFELVQNVEGFFTIKRDGEDSHEELNEEEIKFLEYQAPAILLGFLRQNVYSFLSLSGIGNIHIPLFNMYKVVEQIKNKKS